MKKTCYVFGAGERTAMPDFHDLPDDRSSYMVIAADGGYGWLCDCGIAPDLVIGDFDSLGCVPDGGNVTVLPCRKDTTDMDEAVSAGLKSGCTEFMLYGGTGGRLDHTLANIQLLTGIAKKRLGVRLFGNGYAITAITDGSIQLSGAAGSYISVFSADESASGVYLKGLKYPLTDATLTNSFPLGVSNEFTDETAEISVRNGTLIIYYSL